MYHLAKGGGSISLGFVVSLCDRGKGREEVEDFFWLLVALMYGIDG